MCSRVLFVAALLGCANAARPTSYASALAEHSTYQTAENMLIDIWHITSQNNLAQAKLNWEAWNASCSHLVGNETACRTANWADSPNSICCADGEMRCEMDSSGERYSNAGILGCASECWDGSEVPAPSYCSAQHPRLSVGEDGWITICPIIPKCGECEGAFENMDEEECASEGFDFVLKPGYTTEATCQEDTASGNLCQFCSGTTTAADSDTWCLSLGSCDNPSDATDESTCTNNGGTWTPATVMDAAETTRSACQAVSGNWWKEKNRYEPTQLRGFPLQGFLPDGTCESDSCGECNENIGGALEASGDVGEDGESLLQHLGFTTSSFMKDTQLLADAAAGVSAAAAYAANPSYYDSLMLWTTIANARVASTTEAGATPASIDLSTSGVAFLAFPKNTGSITTSDCGLTCGSDGTSDLTGADQHIFILSPVNYASEDPNVAITLPVGKITVWGGENHGTINVSTTGRVRIGNLENTGAVTVSNSQDIFITAVTNTGGITATGVAASLLNVTSSGPITVDGSSEVHMWDSTNEEEGSIVVKSGSFSIFRSSNAGTITVEGGSIVADIDCLTGGNTGSIVLGAAATGSITIGAECKGTITDNSNSGVTLLFPEGTGLTPGDEATTYKLVISTTLEGMTATEFDTAAEAAFQNVIASAIAGVDAQDVVIISVVNANAASGRRLLEGGVVVEYEIGGFESEDAAMAAQQTFEAEEDAMLLSLQALPEFSSVTGMLSQASVDTGPASDAGDNNELSACSHVTAGLALSGASALILLAVAQMEWE